MSTVDAKLKGKLFDSKQSSTLIVSQKLVNQISYLHRKVGGIEWSGVLLYEVISGDINNPKEMVIKAHQLYLMDVGTSSYTEYEINENQFKMFDEAPQADPIWCEENKATPWRRGHIHTHHNMGVFFSGTDNNELIDNAPNYDYYLSLIVNFACDFKAQIAVEGKVASDYKSKDGSISGKTEDPATFTIEMDIQFEESEEMDEKLVTIKEGKATKPSTTHYGMHRTGLGGDYPYNGRDAWDDYYEGTAGYPGGTYQNHLGVEINHVTVSSFLGKLICLNEDSDLTIFKALRDANIAASTEAARLEYISRLGVKFLDCYNEVFDDDCDFKAVMDKAKSTLAIYIKGDKVAGLVMDELNAWNTDSYLADPDQTELKLEHDGRD